MESRIGRDMRYIMIALLLSACSPYPKIDWPAAAAVKAHPTLLPQAALTSGPAATDPGQELVTRADSLRAKVSGVPQ